MGRLVEQTLPVLFHGVSRQPAHLRHPGQVEESINHILSVERGGMEKRYGSVHVAALSGITTQPAQMHAIDRDSVERYNVVAQNGVIRVFEAGGAERTVNVIGAAGAYVAGNAETDLVFQTIADYTFILNKTKTVALASTLAPTPTPLAILAVNGARQGTFGITLNGTSYTNNPATSNPDATTIANEIRAAIPSATWTVTQTNSTLFIQRVDGADFTAQTVENYPGFVSVYKDRVATTSALPPRAPHGTLMRIGSADSPTGFWVRFEARGGSGWEGIWTETVAPGTQIAFDATTMPHVLVRESSGTFTLKAATWNQKKAGDDVTSPPPEFVGRKLVDITFHRGRMALVAGETVYFSQSGDLFNFWPERTTQVSDADPFGLNAPGASVSILQFATPFRKTLFLTSVQRQFEVTGELLAPSKSSIDQSSAYTASAICRPHPVGDSLFLVADAGSSSALLEYSYDSDSLSNVAEDVSRHARGYVPAGVKQLVGDPLSGTLALRSATADSTLYLYTYFWRGRELVQSAWHKWTLGSGTIQSISLIADNLYVLIRRDTTSFIERVPLRPPVYADYPWRPALDRSVLLTGSYNATTDRTTWTLPYSSAGATVVAPASLNPGVAIVPTFTAPSTITAPGNWSGGQVFAGEPFTAQVELSTLFVRDGDKPITTGRTQVRAIHLTYEDTRVFDVTVIHAGGATFTEAVTVPVLGALTVLPGAALSRGTTRFGVNGRNTQVRIVLSNSSVFPHVFVSGSWHAFFNEVTRQG